MHIQKVLGFGAAIAIVYDNRDGHCPRCLPLPSMVCMQLPKKAATAPPNHPQCQIHHVGYAPAPPAAIRMRHCHHRLSKIPENYFYTRNWYKLPSLLYERFDLITGCYRRGPTIGKKRTHVYDRNSTPVNHLSSFLKYQSTVLQL